MVSDLFFELLCYKTCDFWSILRCRSTSVCELHDFGEKREI